MRLKLKRTPGVFLVGFMGTGKSTVGRVLADDVGWKFVDLDDEIERQEGLTVPQIFDQRGEQAFRDLESAMLAKFVKLVQCGRPHVISLGGGAFLSDHNFTLVTNNGVSVWLDCPLDVVERRVAGSEATPVRYRPAPPRQCAHRPC